MNISKTARTLGLVASLSCAGLVANAEAAGLMKPVNSNLPDLSIREHHVNVVIEDSYAVTSIEQVFHNPNQQQLEAIYSFPVPEKAAVGEFTYWIDGKPVTGEVVEKHKAREIYNQQKQAGNEAALVEQDSYKTFDISVTPVQPDADVRVKLVYVQPAHIDSGVGRYLYPLEDGGVDDQKNAFWSRNEVVDEKFSFNLTLRSSYPIDSVRLPQHSLAAIKQTSANEWQISMANQSAQQPSTQPNDALISPADNVASNGTISVANSSSAISTRADDGIATTKLTPPGNQFANAGPVASLDKDILLYWRHAQGLPGSLDLISYKTAADAQGTFKLTLTPGDDLAPIQGGRDWVFVLDVSGSMQGKYSTLVEGVRQGLAKLRPDDRFKVVLFNNRTEDLSNGFQTATAQAIEPVLQRLEQYSPGSGTNLYAGVARGLNDLDADRSTAMILVTDGVANVGVTEKKRFLKLMEKADIRLFTFVMGNSANQPLLQGMTEVSNGFAISVSNADDIVGQLMQATSKMTHQALHGVELKFNGTKVTDLTDRDINTLYRGEQLTLFGHYRKSGPVKVTLSGKAGSEDRVYSTEVMLPQQSTLHPELERMWAYATIENLQAKQDYLSENADIKQAITDIAVQHDLVTDYTSMIVVRDEVFQQLAIDRNNTERVNREHQARAERKQQSQQQGVRDNRADKQQPMFSPSKPRPSLGGGGSGAIGHWVLLLIGTLLLVQFRNNRNRR
ncbi:VIT and vWA domain-containing protein [Amphritea sp. HPY]|uniref:VIT and vWA domain-containing protein n=1 Tax=Amphritea sp. HPY TaxID=3421652 RepID=UPI003D7E08FD